MLLIYNGKIITMTGIEYKNGYILVDKDKIISRARYSRS